MRHTTTILELIALTEYKIIYGDYFLKLFTSPLIISCMSKYNNSMYIAYFQY
ncbi:hypothetical protein CIT292_06007 [Citrobacter youngae ATCC 29220]|uniref:Uncharacterized protein n=1 Tax=Citrobacter youngae ATCC 29220 TaxID=500640 RepID=D4B6R7_9ENTR|nr:hypothetical protein CIT292_06007 [Citrobacter youngae ATCC 29220]